MKLLKKSISWVLMLTLVFNPIIFEGVAWAGETATPTPTPAAVGGSTEDQKDMKTAATDVSSANKDIQGIDKVKTSWWWPSSWKNKAKDANKKIDAAQAEMTKQTADIKGGVTNTTSIMDSLKASAMQAVVDAKAKVQGALMKIGELMQKIGGIVTTIGTLLITIGAILTCFPYTAAIGAFLQSTGKVLMGVGSALTKVGKTLYEKGKTGAIFDEGFGKTFGDLAGAAVSGYAEGKAAGDKQITATNAKVADFKNTVSNLKETFTAANAEKWTSLKDAASKLTEGTWKDKVDSFKTMVDSGKGIVSNTKDFANKYKTAFNDTKAQIKDVQNQIKTAQSTIKTVGTDVKAIGSSLKGAATGIVDSGKTLVNDGKDKVTGVIEQGKEIIDTANTFIDKTTGNTTTTPTSTSTSTGNEANTIETPDTAE